MASDEKEKESAENVTGRAKRRKVSTKNLPLAPTDPIPSTKITKSRLDFSTAMAKQLLLEQVEKGSNDNFALSPISIDVVLTMVAAGSRGRTLERVLALLGAQDIDEIKSSASEMMAVVAGCGGGRTPDEGGDGLVLCMVNGAWVDKRFPLIDSFREEVLKGIYACNTETVDFQKESLGIGYDSDEIAELEEIDEEGFKANEVVKKVNLWAKEASKGLITNLLQPQSLSPQTAIVLANGLYFKGMWTNAHRFDESLTKKRTFYLLTGDTVSIPFMTSDKKYHYRSFDAFKVLKVPYQSAKLDKKFSMYFFLPHERVGLQNLLEELCSDSGSLKQDYFDLREVSLAKFWIPTFKFSYEFNIAETMKEMGMTFPFVENPEDFSEMKKIPEGIQVLATSMIQKVVVKVEEKGTEAAAVTRARPIYLSYKPYLPKPSFVADHPFLFMIKEKMSGYEVFASVQIELLDSNEAFDHSDKVDEFCNSCPPRASLKAMAPTAAMLMLGYTSKPSSTFQAPSPNSSVFQVKATAAKWVSDHDPVREGTPEARRKSMADDEPCFSSSDSALERKFQRDLQLSCW
ncbi:hypothetical protein RHSIM_Rhsim05G0094700 [Rhododendron simsii]|uniref:Serpin domain-containing protein n=1 Tax=Rhododendron simsii TaxID=118357 RepID=A0A834LPM0_RHOSS|nr:hypothetical protein RHSIM_Rhsim05G0094700 [Rhododendron simsii]